MWSWGFGQTVQESYYELGSSKQACLLFLQICRFHATLQNFTSRDSFDGCKVVNTCSARTPNEVPDSGKLSLGAAYSAEKDGVV